jgi:hypothetical protein
MYWHYIARAKCWLCWHLLVSMDDVAQQLSGREFIEVFGSATGTLPLLILAER